MNWGDNVPALADGGWYGMEIVRRVRPREWLDALAKVPADHRERAEKYLREEGDRIKARREARGG